MPYCTPKIHGSVQRTGSHYEAKSFDDDLCETLRVLRNDIPESTGAMTTQTPPCIPAAARVLNLYTSACSFLGRHYAEVLEAKLDSACERLWARAMASMLSPAS